MRCRTLNTIVTIAALNSRQMVSKIKTKGSRKKPIVRVGDRQNEVEKLWSRC